MGKPKKVVVLLGGKSEEREVSLRTGEAVYQALLEKGYEAAKIDLDEMVVDNLRREKPDVVFIALHGKYGEDGCVQGLLEILGIPYTGCGVRASANCMHKITTKQILVAAGIPTAPYTAVTKSEIDRQGLSAVAERVKKEINIPLVIKPASQGSTIGVQFVREAERLEEGMLKALRYDDELLIEKMFSGTEITAAIMGNRDPVALPLIEIVSHTGVFDYQAKYTPGLSEHIIPARITPEQEKRAKEVAVKTYQTLSCRGLSRVDMMIHEDGEAYVLEVNTIPGMTATSLFPDAARAAGIEFPDLVEKIIELALET